MPRAKTKTDNPDNLDLQSEVWKSFVQDEDVHLFRDVTKFDSTDRFCVAHKDSCATWLGAECIQR